MTRKLLVIGCDESVGFALISGSSSSADAVSVRINVSKKEKKNMYFKIKIINGLHQRFLQSLTKKIGLSISNISQTYILTLNIFDNNKVRKHYFEATLIRILN